MLNNSEMESDSDSQLDSSIDSNESDACTETEVDTGSDNDSDATVIVDVVDDITWSLVQVKNMKRLDFTGNSGLNITLQSPEDPVLHSAS